MEERDAYILKKWGYKYPTSALSHIADGPLALSINMRSSGSLEFQEFYEIKPISILDVSKFQEVLGYQEPLRIDYVNNAEEILKRREDIGERNRQLGRNISRLSFADAYRFAIGAITDTDRESYNDFIQGTRSYKRQVVDYLTDKKSVFSAGMVFPVIKEKLSSQIYPSFSTGIIPFLRISLAYWVTFLSCWRGTSFCSWGHTCLSYDTI